MNSLSSHILQEQKAVASWVGRTGGRRIPRIGGSLMAVCGQLCSEEFCLFSFAYHWAIFFSFPVYFDTKKKIYKNKKLSLMIAKFFSPTK